VRHFIDIQDYTPQELENLLELIRVVKAAAQDGALPPLLAGASLGMIFEEPSTRTRVSFEVAMTKLGGHALYLRPGEIHMGARETIADTAHVLSRMVDGIEARLLKHSHMIELARWSSVPVINGLTDVQHPTQVLCDVFTMQEHMPAGRGLRGLNLAFVGDATNVCNSLVQICTLLGINFTQAAPSRYQLSPEYRAMAAANCARSGARLSITEDVETAVSQADFVYTDLWWWVDQEHEKEERVAAFKPRYQVTRALLDHAPAHAKFMHCLPASRGVEVTDEVMDGPRSIIFDQAENRLHTEVALLVYLIRPQLKLPGKSLVAHHRARVSAVLNERFGIE
jgi:putrescine carbamoyltransferase